VPIYTNPQPTHQQKQQVKLPTSVLRAHCAPPSPRDPLWEALRRRCRRFLRRRQQASEGEDFDEEEEEGDEFSGPRPLMGWPVFVFHFMALALAAFCYCYGFLNESPAKACAAAGGMGVLLWVSGRLGHEGAFVWVCLFIGGVQRALKSRATHINKNINTSPPKQTNQGCTTPSRGTRGSTPSVGAWGLLASITSPIGRRR
jgi:hypothetical protein